MLKMPRLEVSWHYQDQPLHPVQLPCPKPLKELTVLVHHHMSDMYLHKIRERFPELTPQLPVRRRGTSQEPRRRTSPCLYAEHCADWTA